MEGEYYHYALVFLISLVSILPVLCICYCFMDRCMKNSFTLSSLSKEFMELDDTDESADEFNWYNLAPPSKHFKNIEETEDRGFVVFNDYTREPGTKKDLDKDADKWADSNSDLFTPKKHEKEEKSYSQQTKQQEEARIGSQWALYKLQHGVQQQNRLQHSGVNLHELNIPNNTNVSDQMTNLSREISTSMPSVGKSNTNTDLSSASLSPDGLRTKAVPIQSSTVQATVDVHVKHDCQRRKLECSITHVRRLLLPHFGGPAMICFKLKLFGGDKRTRFHIQKQTSGYLSVGDEKLPIMFTFERVREHVLSQLHLRIRMYGRRSVTLNVKGSLVGEVHVAFSELDLQRGEAKFWRSMMPPAPRIR